MSQITPDSLIGTYAGVRWFKWEEDTSWTIFNDTVGVYQINSDCILWAVSATSSMGGIYIGGMRPYKTEYGFCQGNVTNYIHRFHPVDSLIIQYNDISPPPPNYHPSSTRYYGVKISDSILVNISDQIISEKLINIYPNPFTDHLHLQLPLSHKCDIKIFDISGKELYAFTENNIKNLTVNTTALVPGVYILQLVINNNMQSYKIVKL
ncbi:MAG: T9SS type A sorting domain-containing protein [Bacteroidales bacterium]|nr:T9SS type A sorting domain-containing protein [Bacteroidales bacterium]